ncbi:MAG: hypothetical protein HRU09_17520 [Oligoflexales bacterium]|nr:hypothetical protein [Oligoflexales bacterium]
MLSKNLLLISFLTLLLSCGGGLPWEKKSGGGDGGGEPSETLSEPAPETPAPASQNTPEEDGGVGLENVDCDDKKGKGAKLIDNEDSLYLYDDEDAYADEEEYYDEDEEYAFYLAAKKKKGKKGKGDDADAEADEADMEEKCKDDMCEDIEMDAPEDAEDAGEKKGKKGKKDKDDDADDADDDA